MALYLRIWVRNNYNQFNKERKINAYLKKLKALGWEQPTAMVELPA